MKIRNILGGVVIGGLSIAIGTYSIFDVFDNPKPKNLPNQTEITKQVPDKTEETKFKSFKKQDKTEDQYLFGVLINTNDLDLKNKDNVRTVYRFLRSRNINPCYLYVASGPNQNIECAIYYVNQDSSLEGISKALDQIKLRIYPSDTILVYLTSNSKEDIKLSDSSVVSYNKLNEIVIGTGIKNIEILAGDVNQQTLERIVEKPYKNKMQNSK